MPFNTRIFIKIIFIAVAINALIVITVKGQNRMILGAEKQGMCSYYADKFDGRKTYFGEVLDNKLFTAAHRFLPLNTMLAVTNLETKKTVIVRVNDRGPYSHRRLIDISKAAAQQIELIRKGVGMVNIRVIGFDGYEILGITDPSSADADSLNRLTP